MATLQTTITQRINPLTGDTLLYPNIVSYQRIDSQQLIDYMVANSNISRKTAYAAVAAARSIFYTHMLNGHTVVLPQLGTFSLVAKTKAVETIKKANARCIEKLKIRFTPMNTTANACKSVSFRGIVKPEDTVDIITD